MGKHSTARLFLFLAGWTLLAVAIIGVIVVFFGLRSVSSQAEQQAAKVSMQSLAPVLERQAGDLSASSLASFQYAASSMLSDQVRGVRLWGSDGKLLASTGVAATEAATPNALSRAQDGLATTFTGALPSGDALVTYAPFAAGTVLEIDQDYGPIASAVAASKRDLLFGSTAVGVALLVLFPLGIWLSLRGLRAEYARLQYLYRTGQSIRSTLDLTDVLEQLARDASVFLHAQLGVATIVDGKANDMLVKASFDSAADATAQHHRKVEEWFIRRCAATNEIVVTELASFPYGPVLGYEPREEQPVNVVSIPIAGHEGAAGVLTIVRNKSDGPFAAAEVQVVHEMAVQAAMAVEQALLFSKMRAYADEVEISYDATLKVLMAALDTKDSSTSGHSERVSRLTVALARELNVPNERLVDIERGALLHDVGKIGVPDAILRKPDTLNEREWEAMQKHPLLAGLMISKVGFLEGALPILLYHHERYDGRGYPFGLEGKAVPLEARIFAVVDSYDAMTSDRPYRKARAHEQAMEEIFEHTGTQFDPDIVDAFTRVVERMGLGAGPVQVAA